MSKTLIKYKVCDSCCSMGIVDPNCVCTYKHDYDIIELEFEQCDCCGNIQDQPADTPFNEEQFKKHNNE
jgi:hypothetical protein